MSTLENIFCFVFVFLLWVFIDVNFRGKFAESPTATQLTSQVKLERTQDTT